MLRVAVPNKGSLSEPTSQMLREAGYRQRADDRELAVSDPENETEFFFLRPRDIAVYVGSGRLDVGFTGRDLLLDSGSSAVEVLGLGFGRSTFRYAARAGSLETVADRQTSRTSGGRCTDCDTPPSRTSRISSSARCSAVASSRT